MAKPDVAPLRNNNRSGAVDRELPMKLAEALKLAMLAQRGKGSLLSGFLAAGVNPLHLKTFVVAELSLLVPDRRVEVESGLYGDLLGNLRRFSVRDFEFGIVLIEWTDLDPRLGLRSAARWSESELAEILATASSRAIQFEQALKESCQRVPLAISLPTLPLPPFSFVPGWQTSRFDLELKVILQSLSASVCQLGGVRVLGSQMLDMNSPLAERFDIESEIFTGFPYRLPHASALGGCLAQLVRRSAPKKGLITDLDDTLWRGILGEDGIEGISWDLEHGSQMHAFYQRFLGALASEGVLIGIASKNDRALVEDALRRSDLALSPNMIFPVQAHWSPKSQSVATILETWNVGANSVVFVDDSPLELGEVNAAYPEMECLQFPARDNAAIYDLMLRLRDIFGRDAVLEEDSIRLESIRRASIGSARGTVASPTAFIENLEAEIKFNSSEIPMDPRALELVNKTNQFNLNGKRYSEASWHRFLLDPASFLLVASYRDKFGPLGKIAVLGGYQTERKLTINTWVMSCRAFSRRIEHKCLAELVTMFDPDEIEFEYSRTERNGPLSDFLAEIGGQALSSRYTISRGVLEAGMDKWLSPQETVNG